MFAAAAAAAAAAGSFGTIWGSFGDHFWYFLVLLGIILEDFGPPGLSWGHPSFFFPLFPLYLVFY